MLHSTTHFSSQSAIETSYAQYGKAAFAFLLTTSTFMFMRTTGVFWPLGAQAAETDASGNIGHHLERRDAFAVQTESPLLGQPNDLPTTTENILSSTALARTIVSEPDLRIIDITETHKSVEADAQERNAAQTTAVKNKERLLDIRAKRNLQISKKRTFLGSEFRVNSVTADSQALSSAVGSKNGTFLVTWQAPDGSMDGIFGQVFYNNGSKIGAEIKVSTYTPEHQTASQVEALENGNYVAVWDSQLQDGSEWSSYGQLFDAVGTKIGGEFKVNTYSTGSQFFPVVSGLRNSNFVVVWSDHTTQNNSTISGQLFDPSTAKIGNQFIANTNTTGAQILWYNLPAVATLNNGNFIIAWHSSQKLSYDIYAQLFTSLGIKIGDEFLVNTHTSDNQTKPSVTALSNGNFLITWYSMGQDGSNSGVYGQLFDENANKIGNEFRVNTYTIDEQGRQQDNYNRRRGVHLLNGGFIAVWDSMGQDGDWHGIYGQVFNNAGIKVGSEFCINTFLANDQVWPSIATLSNNNIIVTWSSYFQDGSSSGVYAQLLHGNFVVSNVHQNITYTVNDPVIGFNDVAVLESPSDMAIATLTLSDQRVGTLTISRSNSITSTFDTTSGIWHASGFIDDVNVLLSQVNFVPATNYRKSFTIDVFVTDEVSVPKNGQFQLDIDVPVLTNNQLTITEGETIIITDNNLSANDPLNRNQLTTFIISDITGGQFELLNNPAIGVMQFYDTQITNGEVQFAQDGSESVAFNVAVSDGRTTNFPENALITFININDTPILLHPIPEEVIEVNKSFKFSIRSDTFNDPEGDPLTYTANLGTNGSLPEWISFYSNTLSFNGSATKEETIQLRLTATDPQSASANADFNLRVVGGDNFFESINVAQIAIPAGIGLAVLGSCLGVGLFYNKKVQDRQTREQHQFARLIRRHLKLQNVDNFKSQEGQRFIRAVQALSAELRGEQGIDITPMGNNDLDRLATHVADAARNKITPTLTFWKQSKITIPQFEAHIKEIAEDANRRQNNLAYTAYDMPNNTQETFLEDAANAVSQIFSPKAEFV